MKDTFQPAAGNRSKLSYDELRILEDQVLPVARNWCRHVRGLRAHGETTLGYWGEPIPAYLGPRRVSE